MPVLVLLFILVPALELALLIQVGSAIGTVRTLMLIVLTGVVGATLAKRQGLGVLRKLQAETAQGQLPASSLVDGVMVLFAAALLVTPGILTDAVGFSLLVPGVRRAAKRWLWGRLERGIQSGNIRVMGGPFSAPSRPSPFDTGGFPPGPGPNPPGTGPVIDVSPEPLDGDPSQR